MDDLINNGFDNQDKENKFLIDEDELLSMNHLVDWVGKEDDVDIFYDAYLCNGDYQFDGLRTNSSLSIISSVQDETTRDVVDVAWSSGVNRADKIDYLISIGCGALAGLIDSFYVGEFSLERANSWGSEKTNKFVLKVAKLNGYKGDDLNCAVEHLEKSFKLAADSNINDFGGSRQHHFRDFSHHFSLGGLICSLFTQFTGKVIGTDTLGNLLIVDVKDTELIGKNFEDKILYGTVKWFLHMVSDMAGSKKTAGKGTGIPGPLLSLIKELSVLPCFKNKKINEVDFRKWTAKLFNGTLLAKRDDNGKILEPVKFDLRTEIGLLHEAVRQAVPVLINECLIRGIYFIRRLYLALKEIDIETISDLGKIDVSAILPFNNRVIKRMITVSSGVFLVIDGTDAAIRAGIKNQGINVGFFVDYVVRLNFIGIGRFWVACSEDSKYIVEDLRDYKAETEKAKKAGEEYEKTLAGLECLSLNYSQLRVLYSLERLIVAEDIPHTKFPKTLDKKKKWKTVWENKLLDEMRVPEAERPSFFMSEDSIVSYFIQHGNEGPWIHLVALEASIFKAYHPLNGDETDKVYEQLDCKYDYLTSRFPNLQDYVTKKDVTGLRTSYRWASGFISGKSQKRIIGAVVSAAITIGTAGLAYAFAPVIAVAMVGESAAGLSGAALVSHSLAVVGGGSLAAGGFGMAGGTAVITGGGAFLGLLGGSGVSAAGTLGVLSNSSYVLSECARLTTYCYEILYRKYDDIKTISDLELQVRGRIAIINSQLDSLKKRNTKDKVMRERIKVAGKSIKYLRSCDGWLTRLIESPDKEDLYNELFGEEDEIFNSAIEAAIELDDDYSVDDGLS